MKPRAGLSWADLVSRYVRPCWKALGWLTLLTSLSNALLVLQPVLLAAVLSQVLGTAQRLPPPGAHLFDLNHLGAHVVRWLAPYAHGSLGVLALLGGCYVALSVLAALLDYAAFLAASKIRVQSTARIQSDLLQHLLSLDLRFFQQQKTGELLSRVTQDAVSTGQGLGPLVRGLIHYGIQLLAYGLYLWHTNRWLSGGAVAIVALHFLITQALKGPLRHRTRQVYDAYAGLATAVQESVLSIRVAKSFGAERFEHAKLRQTIDAVAASGLRHGRVEKSEAPLRAVLDAAGVIVLLLIAAAQLGASTLTTEGLLLYVYVGRLIITPANHMATNYLWMQSLLGSCERLRELFAQQPGIRDGAMSHDGFGDRIEVEAVSFAYSGRRAIDDVSFTISQGAVVAFVGPSGAGKSTMADLLLRLYDPDVGRICIDGVDIRTLRQEAYRRLFGVVSQECLLFHDTVRNNIRYGRAELTEAAIEAAARLANAHDFIAGLPQGYDTVVGDRGLRLSGGERQRIAIARAIVHQPPLLILDEATSALDSHSERLVQEAIDRIAARTTLIVIAHRLSTVVRADTIILFDGGRIVDLGRHEELLERCALYRHLCELQFAAEPRTLAPLAPAERAKT